MLLHRKRYNASRAPDAWDVLTQSVAREKRHGWIDTHNSVIPPAVTGARRIKGERRTQPGVIVHRTPPEALASAPLLMEFIVTHTGGAFTPVPGAA